METGELNVKIAPSRNLGWGSLALWVYASGQTSLGPELELSSVKIDPKVS